MSFPGSATALSNHIFLLSRPLSAFKIGLPRVLKMTLGVHVDYSWLNACGIAFHFQNDHNAAVA
jgi:hypothetical protein